MCIVHRIPKNIFLCYFVTTGSVSTFVHQERKNHHVQHGTSHVLIRIYSKRAICNKTFWWWLLFVAAETHRDTEVVFVVPNWFPKTYNIPTQRITTKKGKACKTCASCNISVYKGQNENTRNAHSLQKFFLFLQDRPKFNDDKKKRKFSIIIGDQKSIEFVSFRSNG